MNTYRVRMYINGTEDDAISLRKNLAQTVYDEFELGSVYGLSVDTCTPPKDVFDMVMALCMVELEDGLSEKQIGKLMDALPADRKYMQIEFHENNTSAYGFIDAGYYQIHGYNQGYFAQQINSILDNMELESPDGRYMTPDGRQFVMGYFNN